MLETDTVNYSDVSCGLSTSLAHMWSYGPHDLVNEKVNDDSKFYWLTYFEGKKPHVPTS